MKILFLLITIFLSSKVFSNTIYTNFPEKIYPSERYVFYVHGLVLEGNVSDRPINKTKPQWGIYEFPLVKNSLSDSSYNLIAIKRDKNTDKNKYAIDLSKKINILIKNGVLPENITIIGFSRGGEITILLSNYMKNEKLNFIILAACSGEIKENPSIKLYGRILSIYEKSDKVGSCKEIQARSKSIVDFKEIKINTNQQHGAFFRPNKEWVNPVKNWIKNE